MSRRSDIALLRASRYFDPEYYLRSNPDVAMRRHNPYRHYLNEGGLEGRQPSELFNGRAYLAAYPEVAQAGENPLVHFLTKGHLNGQWAGLVHAGTGTRKTRLAATKAENVELVRESDLFDADWYRRMNGLSEEVDAAEHYIAVGAPSGLAPSPRFDGLTYLRQNMEVGDRNPLLHYLRSGRSRRVALGLSADVRSVLVRNIADWSEIEPDIATPREFHDRLELLPVRYSLNESRLALAWQQVMKASSGARFIVFAPWLSRGGADLVAVNMVKALQVRAGVEAVVLVTTDNEDSAASDWLPADTRYVRFSAAGKLGRDDRRLLVEKLIWAVRPEAIFNVNSRACWDAMVISGKALASMTALHASLFCRDYLDDGRVAGYSDTHIRAALPHLTTVQFDTRGFIDEIRAQYGLGEDLAGRLRFLPTPVETRPRSATPRTGRPRVLWAGRFARQKNPELLMAIAASAPDLDFDVWGGGVRSIESRLEAFERGHENVTLKGGFAGLAGIAVEDYDAFLFTSHFEGMPTIVLGIAGTGLPIVATAVGGVGEIVTPESGWPIDDPVNPEPYVQALREATGDDALRARKSAAMADLLGTERSWQHFEDVLWSNL